MPKSIEKQASANAGFKPWDFIAVLCILLCAGLLIFYKFPQIPQHLSFDEVSFAKLALSLARHSYIPYSPLATGHSTLYFYALLLSFRLFGVGNFALRLPSALAGITSAVLFFLCMRTVFNNLIHIPQDKKKFIRALPFVLGFILLTSRWFFDFARFSFEATFLLFLELGSLYFLLRFLTGKSDKKAFMYIFLSGIFAGFAYNSYTPGRIFFLVPLLLTIVHTVHSHNFTDLKNKLIRPLVCFLIPFILLALPLTFYLSVHPDSRFDKQFFLKNTEMTVAEKLDFLGRNISSIALEFNVRGDINGRHNYPGKPALNPVLGILFLAGLAIAIKNWRSEINTLFLSYFLISLIPAVLTYPWENPNMLRTYTVIPSLVYFMGIALIKTYGLVRRPLSKKLLFGLLILLLGLSSIYEIRTYFVYQTKVFPKAFEIKYPLPQALKMPL